MNIWINLEAELLKLLPLISALLLGIAGPIGVVYYKHWLFRKSTVIRKKKEEFNNTLSIQDSVNTSLNNLQAKHNLDRLWVAQFHNGGNFYPGNKSMKKMSVTFESTAPGIATDIMRMQNMPISFFSACLQRLNTEEGEKGIMIDIHDEADFAVRDYWSTKGTNTVYLFPVKSIEDLFIGILGIEFIKQDETLTDEQYRNVSDEAKLLSGYIAALSIDKG
jgi:hypothetical protein